MKKATVIFLLGITIFTMSACGNNTQTVENNSTEVTEDKNNSTSEPKTEVDKKADIRYADLLPSTSDYFKNGKTNVIDQDGGTSYVFQITNYQDGEYESYVEACKNMGFDDVTYDGENDGGKMFYAYSNDGKYYLQVSLGYQIEAIDVICKESTKNKSNKNVTN